MWKKIENTNYEVCTDGRVRNKNGYILTPNIKNNGYHQVRLSIEGKQKSFLVHRLVMLTFAPIDNPDDFQVNHIDENKSNNDISNLEWCDREYNCNYGARNDKVSATRGKAVNQYDLDGNFIKQYPSSRIAGNALGIYPTGIRSVCRGERKTAGGFKWEYA